jgi:beta-galactosidase/beta-glucuronidase
LDAVKVDAGQQEVFDVTKSIPEVRAWSPAQPALYMADVRLVSEDKVIDQVGARFGFPKVEARGERLYLNEEPVF